MKVFHLYSGFSRKVTKTGYKVKGSVRVIQPMLDPYKGFTIKRINKGKVMTSLIIRQRYNYRSISGITVTVRNNVGVLMKDGVRDANTPVSDHILGPCFRLLKRKKLIGTFKASI